MVSSRLSPIGVLGVAVIASAGLAVVGDAAGALALPSAAAALVALAALIRVGFGARRDRGAVDRAAFLAAALEREGVARLVVTADGAEVFRSRAAHRVLGPAADPLAVLAERAVDNEHALGEIERLRAAAAAGVFLRADLALGLPGGGREWYAVEVRHLESAGGWLWQATDVSARRAVDDTLRREIEFLGDFVDLLPVGCYSADVSGSVRWVNQRLAEWLGRQPADLMGRPLSEVLGTEPDPEGGRTELSIKGRGDEVFQAVVAHSVFDDGGEMFTRSVVMRDLVPERQWERALRSAERRFRWLFDDAPVGIALVDLDGVIGTCNLALQAMLGIGSDQMAGRPVAEYIAPDQRAEAAEQLAKVLGGSLAGTHLDVRLKGRRDLIAQLFVSPTHEDGDISGLVIHFIDATEQRNLELQFAQSQKMQAMGQLAGGVAHDFNNLLTAMIGFCDLLLQRHGPGDPSFADIMQVRQNANRAASLVRQLLAFSRRQALQPRLLNVTDSLADLSNLLRRLLGETIELRIVHGRHLGPVRVDPGQFYQVIINLAVNARDAMPGGGTLTIRTNAVQVADPVQRGPELMPPGDYILIEVSDTGTGMPGETIARIFEPFFSTKEVGAGTGLGLSTVYGIVRQTDGFIFVASELGQGTTFSIYLPKSAGAAEGVATVPSVPPPAVPAPDGSFDETDADLTGSGTVLLVEDEDAVRMFGARALKNKGYRVIEARSGEQALDVLRGDEPVNVLVSDVVMPGMDGITLARLVRLERPHIRVILISGYSEDVSRDGIDPSDGIHFLPKPFSLKQLAGAVKQVLSAG